ncbi:hypothetical protein [Fibrobacter succinogenes]|uniref:hypothetical protein n=1 Tax=Fibrobacter succinogenes TaxID=833 RepID=UPI0015685E97|nr:hypothetical protein [Fibrobacter succinogenes]
MNFNMNMRKILLTSAIAFSAASAFAADGQAEVVTQQKSLLEKLDSLNAAVLGLKINGTAKGGVAASFASSDQFATESPTQENQAFTDVNLRLTARPSSETMIDVQLRLHKDWQSAYDENNNPVIGHWFSYDGTILNKHVDFNLGYMRVGYTPLTIFTPQTEILQEPEIFSEKRREALEKRNLDTTSRRLLHGLNVVYNSRNVGVVDNITAQLTGARLRNTAKKSDQVFFDFDFSDRYLLGARVGAEAYGAYLGVNFVNAMDRKLTRRSLNIDTEDTVYYETNRVISVEAAFDSKKLLPELPVTFGFNGEFAMSKWAVDRDYFVKEIGKFYTLEQAMDNDGKNFVYVKSVPEKTGHYVETNEKVADQDGKSFYADFFVKGDINDIDFKVNVGYFQTDSGFWSEQASSPVYQGRSTIFNANAFYGNPTESLILSTFGASSLENLYFNVYNSTTLQATNLMSSTDLSHVLDNRNESGASMYANLYNNYKNGHFYRNGYSGVTAKKREIDAQGILLALDPSVGLALPLGLATPDRKGITAKADVNWADKVSFNARVNIVTQSNALDYSTLVVGENKFTEYAVGLGVDVGALAALDRQILVQGSVAMGSESAYLKRKTSRFVGGVTADIWGPFSFLGGVQMYTKEFGFGYPVSATAVVNKATEMLVLAGPRVKLAPLSYLSLQGGMLKNELDYTIPGVAANKISINKLVLLADVTVNF